MDFDYFIQLTGNSLSGLNGRNARKVVMMDNAQEQGTAPHLGMKDGIVHPTYLKMSYPATMEIAQVKFHFLVLLFFVESPCRFNFAVVREKNVL